VALALVAFPLATFAARCRCDASCPLHGAHARGAVAAPSCHGGSDAAAGSCEIVAPCRHASNAAPALAFPPAVLTAFAGVPAPVAEPAVFDVRDPAAAQFSRAVFSPPPRRLLA
jgi:hypothetical protein